MDLRIFTEPQEGASYATLLAIAQKTEECGFDGFFRSDHYISFGGGDGLPGPTDAWITLAGIARETSRIRLGTLVSPATFRLPGPLAIQVAQVDQMSGGRVELGLGTGWNAREHEAYGIPFPDKRFDLFEEQLAIVTGLWESPVGKPFSFAGEHYQLDESPGLPKPAQSPRPPIIIGGTGPKRTPALTAKYAQEYNVAAGSLERAKPAFETVRAACTEVGRDPNELVYSVWITTAAGRDDAEVARRAAAIGQDVAGMKQHGLSGTPAEIVDRLGQYAEIGASRVYLQILDLDDLDHLEVLASDVLPQVS
jgi:F420-dependent oxidoreductase-like protein